MSYRYQKPEILEPEEPEEGEVLYTINPPPSLGAKGIAYGVATVLVAGSLPHVAPCPRLDGYGSMVCQSKMRMRHDPHIESSSVSTATIDSLQSATLGTPADRLSLAESPEWIFEEAEDNWPDGTA